MQGEAHLGDKTIEKADEKKNNALPDLKEPVFYMPEWIKSNAEFWSKNQINDETFLNGIKYLIQEDIILIPETLQTTNSDSSEVPEWVKITADLWTTNLITDKDFLNGIEFLIKNGIISL